MNSFTNYQVRGIYFPVIAVIELDCGHVMDIKHAQYAHLQMCLCIWGVGVGGLFSVCIGE